MATRTVEDSAAHGDDECHPRDMVQVLSKS
jgi:hypothetical protein